MKRFPILEAHLRVIKSRWKGNSQDFIKHFDGPVSVSSLTMVSVVGIKSSAFQNSNNPFSWEEICARYGNLTGGQDEEQLANMNLLAIKLKNPRYFLFVSARYGRFPLIRYTVFQYAECKYGLPA